MKEILQKHKQYLLTGVSYVIPFIACGGILIALSLAYAFHFHLLNEHGGPDPSQAPWFVQDMFTVGVTAFQLFPAVLAGFIAYGMAGKPGLVPGFIGGLIAGTPQTVGDKHISAGFLRGVGHRTRRGTSRQRPQENSRAKTVPAGDADHCHSNSIRSTGRSFDAGAEHADGEVDGWPESSSRKHAGRIAGCAGDGAGRDDRV